VSPLHRPPRPRAPRREPAWADWDEERLLDLRLCDLGLRLEGSEIERRVERLHRELQARGLTLRPHVWFSTEWFSPDGIPGIALPFYLGHPRLVQLERRQMLEVEGGSERESMRILRHEAGHAVATAWRLPRRARYQRVFGRARPYPEFYSPRPFSRSYVLHLDAWYAQSHPSEDFAETFAVWLAPRARWRQAYAGWPALRKLQYVDELMGELAGTTPPVRSRRRVEPISGVRRTLREHYEWKRHHYGTEYPEFYDRDLRRLFSAEEEHRGNETAVSFVRRLRPEVRATVAHWTGLSQYTIDQVLRDVMGRCKELRLRVGRPDRETKADLTVMLTVQTMNYLHGGHHRLAL
jgi:hypothetical protein